MQTGIRIPCSSLLLLAAYLVQTMISVLFPVIQDLFDRVVKS